MAISLAQNAIAFLIDLAEKGELDPWDVKVIEVMDRFLQSLGSQPTMGEGRSPYEASLSESGQAFLYAAMLVLLKADTLVRAEVAEEEEEFRQEAEEFLELVEETGGALPRNLERRLHRRAIAPPPERRPVTLQELITQLETIAAVMSDDPTKGRPRRTRPHPKGQAVRAITQLAHQENLSEIAAALEAFLERHWHLLGQAADWIEFDTLLHHWPHHLPPQLQESIPSDPLEADRHERVGVFWGLLYLSAQSKVELSQETFYQDLHIRPLTPEQPG